MADPIEIANVTGVRVYTSEDKINGACVNVQFVGTPFTVMIGTPLADGKLPPADYTVIFKGN